MDLEGLKNNIDGLKYSESLRISCYFLIGALAAVSYWAVKVTLLWLQERRERMKDKEGIIADQKNEIALLKNKLSVMEGINLKKHEA